MNEPASSILLLGFGIAIGFVLGVFWAQRRASRGDGRVSRSTLNEIADEDTGDVAADAERRMAYGAYQAASELLEAAISGSPNDPSLLAKHLEVLFIWGKDAEFLDRASDYASILKGSSDWERIRVMGATMHPGHEMFR